MRSRIAPAALSVAALVLLAACLPSMHPFWSEETLVFEPALLGVWVEDDDTVWTVERGDAENSYRVALGLGEDRTVLEGRLFRLGDTLYMDATPEEGSRCDYSLALHWVVQLQIMGDRVQLRWLDGEAFARWRQHRAAGAAYEALEENTFVLTADTEELQLFLRKQARKGDLWSVPEMFFRKR